MTDTPVNRERVEEIRRQAKNVHVVPGHYTAPQRFLYSQIDALLEYIDAQTADAERWRFFRDRYLSLLHDYEEERQYLFIDSSVDEISAEGYENTVDSLIDAVRVPASHEATGGHGQ